MPFHVLIRISGPGADAYHAAFADSLADSGLFEPLSVLRIRRPHPPGSLTMPGPCRCHAPSRDQCCCARVAEVSCDMPLIRGPESPFWRRRWESIRRADRAGIEAGAVAVVPDVAAAIARLDEEAR